MSFSWPRLFGFSLPILALGSPILITIPKQLFSETPSIHHYFFRVPFANGENHKKDQKLSEDSNRLAGYYKKYLNHQTHINKLSEFGTSSVEGSNQPNLFIQVQRKEEIKNREWEWLQTVKFNQLTIDRWIEKNPNDKELVITEQNQFKELIKVEHLLQENAKLTRNAINQDAIDIYFKTAHIEKDEIRKLVYVPTSKTSQNNWFVWLDKELLRLKLNFGFHIWFFNQPEFAKYGFVKSYFNKKEKSQLKEQLSSLYESLSQDEKDFFELYFQTWVSKGTNRDYERATLKPMELESKDLNIAYHWLSDKSKSLGLFKGHLVQVLKGGDKEAFESFFPNHINYAGGPDALYELKGTTEYQPNVKLTITPNKQIDKDWNVPIVLDWIKNYSVKNFTLRTQDNQKDQWPALLLDSKDSSSGFPVIRSNYLSQPIST